jgi:hypothetical protein
LTPGVSGVESTHVRHSIFYRFVEDASRALGTQITASQTQEENIVMAKKSVWALCFVALLAVAFALPASAQDSQDRGISVRATEMHVVNAPEIPPPATIFMNFGTFVAANCPNGNSQYTQCSWVPSAWLLCGLTAGGGCVNATAMDIQENLAVPFTPKVNATMHHVEIPVQCINSTGGVCNAGTFSYTASVQADVAGVPSGVYLKSHHVTAGTEPFWTCCATGVGGGTVVALGPQALTAGTQYWIVADTNAAADTTTQDGWAWSGFEPYLAYCAVLSPATCPTTAPQYVATFTNENPAVKVY